MIGVLTQDEPYDSLAAISASARRLLRRRYPCVDLHVTSDMPAGTAIEEVRDLFSRSEAVVSLRSQAPRLPRSVGPPALIFAHAWMDHAAGIAFHLRARNFLPTDTIAFASSGALDKFRRVYDADVETMVLPYFVPELRRGRPWVPQTDRNRLAARYGLDPSRKWVFAVGRLGAEKNTEALVGLWQELRRHDAVLVLVGGISGVHTVGFGRPDDRPVRGLMASISAGDRPGVVWVGPQPAGAVRRLLSQAEVLAHPTLAGEEDFGLVAAEALAAGVPVVCSDWGGLRDIVTHGETGYRARTWLSSSGPSLDLGAFARAISAILDDGRLRDRLGLAGSDRAWAVYSEDAFMERLEGVIARLVERAPASAPRTTVRVRPPFVSIYRAALRSGKVDRIYDHPSLSSWLYRSYATPLDASTADMV